MERIKNRKLLQKIIKLIEAGYAGCKCLILHKEQTSKPFEAKSGVRQGSPILFVMDMMLCKTVNNKVRGMSIRWGLTNVLEDLECADDVYLFTSMSKHSTET